MMKKVGLLLVLLAFLAGCESAATKQQKQVEDQRSFYEYVNNEAKLASLDKIEQKYYLTSQNEGILNAKWSTSKVLQNLGKGNYLVHDDLLGDFYLVNYYDPNLVDGFDWAYDSTNSYTPRDKVILKKDGIFKYTTPEGKHATVNKYKYLVTATLTEDPNCVQEAKGLGACGEIYTEVHKSRK